MIATVELVPTIEEHRDVFVQRVEWAVNAKVGHFLAE